MSLSHSYRVAQEIMKQKATSFYQAFFIMDTKTFMDIAAIYAFCRYADDLADDSNEVNSTYILNKLDELEMDVRSLYQKEVVPTLTSKHEWWMAFEHTVKFREIPLEPFLLQIEGQRHDVLGYEINTVEDLIDYSKKVAGSVGLMLAPMLKGDCANESFYQQCEALGIAMQITNILRDIGEDIRERNRIYIPLTLRQQYNVTELELRQLASKSPFKISSQVILLWEQLAIIANQYYEQFYKSLYMFCDDAMLPVTAASVFYQEILNEIRNRKYNCFTQRCYTSSVKRLRLMKDIKKRIKISKSERKKVIA